MRCNPWRWLWGLLLIAPLSWMAFHLERPGIEADISARAREALDKSGYGWAEPQVTGRDVVVAGRAADEAEPKAAFDTVRRVWGARRVDLRTDLVPKVDAFTWSANHSGGKLKLSGYVPNEDVRRQVLAAAKAQFPGAGIDDGMQLARGGPGRDQWLAGVGFGLKQLSLLKSGRADLEGTQLSLAGPATDSAAFKSVRAALSGGLPSGWTLGIDKVTAPVVSPFTWAAKLAGGQVLLTGFVPSDAVRDEIFARAKVAFPKLTIVDRMEIAEGAPDGYSKAALLGLDQLAPLKEGLAELSDKKLALSGVAEEEATAEGVRKAWKAGVPGGMKATDKITFLRASLPTASPFTTRLDMADGAVELTGYVPSEAARSALVAALKERLKGKAIKDRLQLANGAPQGWQTCAIAGVAGLESLTGKGRADLVDARLVVAGETESESVAKSIAGKLAADAGNACTAEAKLTVPRLALSPVPTVDDGKLAELQARWAEAEARWATQNSALEQQAAALRAAPAPAGGDSEARRRAEAEARWRQSEARWAEIDAKYRAEYEARLKAQGDALAAAERQRLAAEEAQKAQRRLEGDRCQKLLTDAAAEGTILFSRASSDLDRKSTPTLRRLAGILKSCPGFRVEIEGHTDSEGIPERNKPLSERRAKAVAGFLAAEGVESGRLTAVGYGAERPIVPNDSPANMAKNRRIEFFVIND